ncbi:tetratricopeptide repeat-containing sensor histidine kinase [Flavobacterium mesophilum]|uniref:tetratricopeptide repeat-containing sensor histidine kinase n=1 Tax=Flavobacterium mesophilum TaxID=3143495 RepID=UPI0031E2E152
MSKNLFRFFQKNYIIICLVLFTAILVVSFSVPLSEIKSLKSEPVNKDHLAKITKTLKKGKDFLKEGKIDSAIFYLDKTQLLCRPIENYVDEYLSALNHRAEALQRTGDFNAVGTTLTKTFPYLEKSSNPKYAINAYTIMAYNYYYIYDYEQALYYHKKALKKAVSTFRKAQILSEIAFVYMQQKKYNEAIALLEPLAKYKIIDKVDPSNTDVVRSSVFYQLGLCYLRAEKDKQLTLNCFNESFKLTNKTNDYELIASYYAYYLFYDKYNNPELKKSNIEKAYYCAKRAKSVSNQVNMLAYLIEADSPKNTKKHWKIYSRMVDSLMLSRKKAQNQFADVIYNSKKDKDENLYLKNKKAENELQLERQKNRSIISYVIITFSIFLVLFLSFYMSSKGKKEKNDAIYLSENRISKKLDDELANDLYHTIALIQKGNLEVNQNKDQLLNNLENIYSKARNISKENSFITTDENYISELKEMISGYKTQKVNILLQGFDTVRWNQVEKNKKIILYRIMQELFLNMKKHSEASLVSVIMKVSNHNLTVLYIDNGIGTKNNALILKNGLQNVENRIKTIKGTITFDKNSDKGFKLSFTFPI